MIKENTLERYMEALLEGNRNGCRKVVEETLQCGIPANQVYMDLIWPIMIEVDILYRNDKIDSAQESMATRINRTLIDQLQNKLPRKDSRQRKVVVCCSSNEHGELGGQMIADLFESDGWEVRFLGSSVNNDDILTFVHSFTPDILLAYGTTPQEAPNIRRLIDTVKAVNAFPEMKIMLSGGIFNRAEGLWEEIGADLYASTAEEAIKVASMSEDEAYTPTRTINRRKHTKKAKTLPAKLLADIAQD